MSLPRFRIRTLMIAVPVMALTIVAVVKWLEVSERRPGLIARARQNRGYEATVRFWAGRFDSCAAKHSTANQRSCQSCGVHWDYMRTLDGLTVRSAAEAAAAYRQAAGLFARMAQRQECMAYTPWFKPLPFPPAERQAWDVLNSGNGPLDIHFFTVQ